MTLTNSTKIFILLSFIIAEICLNHPSIAQSKQSHESHAVNKVLIIGNSIVVHKPAPDKGWYGNWGMAASEEQKDFVHLLIHNFKDYNKRCEVHYVSVALNFERKFWMFDTLEFLPLKVFEPDLIILRLGDNVVDSLAAQYTFSGHLKKFVNFLKKDHRVKVCITNCFIPKKNVDQEIEKAAKEAGWTFVSLTDLSSDQENTAARNFKHPGVARHPSDKGMCNIADRIWQSLRPDLKM